MLKQKFGDGSRGTATPILLEKGIIMTMKHILRASCVPAFGLFLLGAGLASPALAHGSDHQEGGEKAMEGMHEHAMMEGDDAMAMSGDAAMKESLIGNFDEVSKKLLDLAEAFPAEKYSWRPAEGIRSVSEVFMHVTGANFFLSTPFGQEMPADMEKGMEQKVTEKADVIAWLKRSIAHARGAFEAADLAAGGEKVPFFGQEMSKDSILLILLSHNHEHLGQAIAYARSTGVVPPWSAGS